VCPRTTHSPGKFAAEVTSGQSGGAAEFPHRPRPAVPSYCAEGGVAHRDAVHPQGAGRRGGHVGRCAKICGMSRARITANIAEYGIDKDRFKEP